MNICPFFICHGLACDFFSLTTVCIHKQWFTTLNSTLVIASMRCGGSSEVKPADAEVKEICQKVITIELFQEHIWIITGDYYHHYVFLMPPQSLLLLFQIKGAAETHAAKKFECFEAVEYSSQMVAGTNYFVKVSGSHSPIDLVS